MVHASSLVVWACTRPPALFIYHILFPIQIAYAVQAIVTREFDTVNHYAVSIVLLGALYCVLWALGGVYICKNGKIGSEYIQKKVFANYLQKNYEFYNNTFIGSLGAQAARLREAYNEYCILMMNVVPKQTIIVVASLVIIGSQSIALAFITLAAMAGILSFTIATSRWRLKYRRRLSVASNELSGIVGDALGHGTTVKSFAAEDYEQSRLDKALSQWSAAQYWSWMASIPADVGRMILAAVATAAILVMTAHLYQQGNVSIAIVALVQLYVIKLITAAHDIADMIKSYDAVMSAAHQPAKTMLIEPTLTDPLKPRRLTNTKSTVTFQDTTFRYNDAAVDVAAIASFNLHIKPGEKVGLVGYSGSGKTTLTKLLLRFMDITTGAITVGDIDIRDLKQQDLRKHIAYVPQEPLLFHRSVAENIAYGKPSAPQKAVMQAAKAAYVDEFVSELPKGYDTLVGERGVKLSGGQRQRVAIARAILKDAPILVLDEATSALDSRSEQLIQKALWRLMKGRTALVIAHRLSTIQHMDKIVVMDKGRIVQTGTHAELLTQKHGIYASLWTHQSGGYLGGLLKDTELTG